MYNQPTTAQELRDRNIRLRNLCSLIVSEREPAKFTTLVRELDNLLQQPPQKREAEAA